MERWGISGVFFGTIISTVSTCFWVEPYILFKYVFQTKSAEYFWRTAVYLSLIHIWVVCFLACLKIGAISVLGNTANKESETAYLLKNGDIKMILMDEGLSSVRYEEVMENLCPGCLDRIWRCV